MATRFLFLPRERVDGDTETEQDSEHTRHDARRRHARGAAVQRAYTDSAMSARTSRGGVRKEEEAKKKKGACQRMNTARCEIVGAMFVVSQGRAGAIQRKG